MAIYSCNLSSIGKTTHQPGTAGAHIRYIARPAAQPVIVCDHIPADPQEARNWIDRAERAGRKNARVLDKIRIALPRELNEEQRAQLVRDLMADLTGGQRVPWFAAIHQTGKDAHNPHVHIDVHDRGLDTGKRVLRLSDSTRDRLKAGLSGPKAVDWIRDRWQVVCNRALARAGHEARVDRRTLEAQGIDRAPTIHEGPRAAHINDNVKRPQSKPRTNGAGRVIDYPAIDKGVTRREFNAHIIDLNLERAVRSGNPETAVRAQFEKDQQAKDRALESRLAAERRARTKELRRASGQYTAQRRRVRAEHRLKSRRQQEQIQAAFTRRREALRKRQGAQRQALRKKHKRLTARIARRLSGGVRARQIAERARQVESHREERRLLSVAYRQARTQAKDSLAADTNARIEAIEEKRTADLAALEKRHRQAEDHAEIQRQQREAEREQERALTERRIREWKERRTGERTPYASRAHEGSQRTAGATGRRAKDEAVARAVDKTKKKQEEQRRRRRRGQGRERGR